MNVRQILDMIEREKQHHLASVRRLARDKERLLKAAQDAKEKGNRCKRKKAS